MVDRLLHRAVATGALVLAYSGLLQALEAKLAAGSIDLSVGVTLGFGAWMLARNRNDLADC
jgi:hypothetical protein